MNTWERFVKTIRGIRMNLDEIESEEEGRNRRSLDVRRFRFETTVTITHILTTLALLVKLFEWGGSVETRISSLQTESDYAKSARLEDEARVTRSLSDIKSDVHEVNSKLDRILIYRENKDMK